MRRRALLGTAVLAVLVALAGLAAYLTREGRSPSDTAAPPPSSPTASASSAAPSGPHIRPRALPVPPKTHDPITYGKAATAALWSYDTRAYSQPELRKRAARLADHGVEVRKSGLRRPGGPLGRAVEGDGGQQAGRHRQGQRGHFPHAFTQALQDDPGAITQAYVYAVTVSGKQAIRWKGSAAGGAESRSTTLAVQCRPNHSCALVGVMPSVAP